MSLEMTSAEFPHPGEHPRCSDRYVEVHRLLLDSRTTLGKIAAQCGVSRTLVSLILYGKRKGYRHRAQIARALGVSVEKLFSGAKRRKAA